MLEDDVAHGWTIEQILREVDEQGMAAYHYGSRERRYRRLKAEIDEAIRREEASEPSVYQGREFADKLELAFLLEVYLHYKKPVTSKQDRNARLRQLFADSGMTANAFALVHAEANRVTTGHMRKILSDQKCATNAQPRRRDAKHNGPKRTNARVPHDATPRENRKGPSRRAR